MVRTAARHERAGALRLLLGHLPAADRDSRVFGILDLMHAGEVDPEGLFVTPDLRGATLASPVAGGGGLIWPPVCDSDVAAAALTGAACAWLRAKGARLVQALIPAGSAVRGGRLLANGFRHVTSLITLIHELTPGDPLPAQGRLTHEPYDPDSPATFHETLLRTYEGSMDCPEVSGVRTVEEVIEGHKGQGPFDPTIWWLVRDAGRPAGVVIQVDNRASQEREVAYVGVVPEARRRGVGREVMGRVFAAARAAGLARVMLAVDERNLPAYRLYLLMGFEEVDRQQVFLRVGP